MRLNATHCIGYGVFSTKSIFTETSTVINRRQQSNRNDVVLMSFFLNVELISDLFLHFYCWLWTSECFLGKDPGETITKSSHCFERKILPKMESKLSVLFMKLIKVLMKLTQIKLQNLSIIPAFAARFLKCVRPLWIWSHLLMKSLIENFFFCAVKRAKHELLNNLEVGPGILSMASSKYYKQRKPNSFLVSKMSAYERT